MSSPSTGTKVSRGNKWAARITVIGLSVLLLMAGWVTPSRLGQAFVIAQALAVAGFAELQLLAWRRAHRAGPLETARA